jgi:thiol-disulfide isomerase/thioredoxin
MLLASRFSRSIRLRIIALVGLALLAGLVPSSALALGPLGPGDAAPELVGTAPGSTEHYRYAYSGVTLINFWGVWCVPCKKEMPALQEIWQKRKDDGFNVVGVIHKNTGTKEKLDAFLAEVGVTYEIMVLGKNWAKHWNDIVYFPTSFLVDENGIIPRRYTGAIKSQITGMLNDINAVLDGKPMEPQVIIDYEDPDLSKK